jgi:hypothetical protein
MTSANCPSPKPALSRPKVRAWPAALFLDTDVHAARRLRTVEAASTLESRPALGCRWGRRPSHLPGAAAPESTRPDADGRQARERSRRRAAWLAVEQLDHPERGTPGCRVTVAEMGGERLDRGRDEWLQCRLTGFLDGWFARSAAERPERTRASRSCSGVSVGISEWYVSTVRELSQASHRTREQR